MGIDFGSENISIYESNNGTVLREASAIAVNTINDKVIYIGKNAKEILGKTPEYIKCIKPVKNGSISSIEFSEILLCELIKNLNAKKFKIHNVVITIPSILTNLDKIALLEVCKILGAKKLALINKSLAGLLGCGINTTTSTGHMIVDIGASCTEIGVVSLGGCVLSECINSHGDAINYDIINYVKSTYNIHIGFAQANILKESVHNIMDVDDVKSVKTILVFRKAIPYKLNVPLFDIVTIIRKRLYKIIEKIKDIINTISPELKNDILVNGIILIGGHCNIANIDKFFESVLEIKVTIPQNPLTSVCEGAGYVANILNKTYINSETNEIVLLN